MSTVKKINNNNNKLEGHDDNCFNCYPINKNKPYCKAYNISGSACFRQASRLACCKQLSEIPYGRQTCYEGLCSVHWKMYVDNNHPEWNPFISRCANLKADRLGISENVRKSHNIKTISQALDIPSNREANHFGDYYYNQLNSTRKRKSQVDNHNYLKKMKTGNEYHEYKKIYINDDDISYDSSSDGTYTKQNKIIDIISDDESIEIKDNKNNKNNKNNKINKNNKNNKKYEDILPNPYYMSDDMEVSSDFDFDLDHQLEIMRSFKNK